MASILSLLLLFTQPLPYACGPFLLQPGIEKMTVVVDHDEAVTAEIIYGIEGQPAGEGQEVGARPTRIEHVQAARHHVFALTGLKPGSRYWYEVRTGETLSSGRRSFRTLPASPNSYRIVALGDVRSLPQRWHMVSERVFQHEKDALFVVGTGDYPADGRKYDQWRKQFFEPARNLLAAMPMWPAIGNHEATRKHDDLTRPEASHYFSLFELPGNERWYRVDYQLLTLLIVDSNSHMSPEHEQYKWLRKQLRSERKRFTMVAFHHAPFTSGPHGALQPDATPKEWPLDESRRFLVPLFEMYGVDVVLNGHDHLYERSVKNGVPYVVSGGGGAPLYRVNSVANPYQVFAKSTNHYVGLNISKQAIELQAIDPKGTVIDTARFTPRAENLARRSHFISKRVQSHLTTGKPQLKKRTLPCVVHNPLDHKLRFEVWMEEGEWQSQSQTIELAAGETKTAQLPLAAPAAPEAKPWQSYRSGKLKATAIGQAEALPIKFTFERRIELRAPRYELTTIAQPAIDGDAKEWQDVPAIRIDTSNPVPRGAKQFSGRGDFEADLRMAISEKALHVLVEVRDDAVIDNGKSPMFECDSFHLMLQSEPSQPLLRRPKTFSIGSSGRASREVQCVARSNPGGYTIEASIPLAQTPLSMQRSGKREARFEIVLVDRDARGAPSMHRLWTPHLRANAADYGVLHAGSK